MKMIRFFLSFIVRAVDYVCCPAVKKWPKERQRQLDEQSALLSLYEFKACPFCVKVRWAMCRLGLTIRLYDAKKQGRHRKTLLEQGGKVQVPCLRIKTPEGTKWLYESKAIISYLTKLSHSPTFSINQSKQQ